MTLTELTILSIIAFHSSSNNIDTQTAINIAKCESSLNPLAKNPNSSALGIYQFTDGTWKWTKCTGVRTNPVDSTKCFVKFYKKYPSWWECK